MRTLIGTTRFGGAVLACLLAGSLALPSPALARRVAGTLLEISALEDRRSLGEGRLAELLRDKHAETRAASARALGRIGSPDGIAPLLEALSDSDENVRMEVLFALGQIGNADARDAVARVANSNVRVRERQQAVLALGKLEGEGAAEAVLPLLADPDPAIRSDAAVALARTGDEVVANDLRPLLSDSDASVRAIAAWATGRLNARDLMPEIRTLLEDSDPDVRLAATKTAGQLIDPQAIGALQLLVRDPDWRVRANVATSLGAMDTLESLPGLTLLAKDDNVHVRAATAAALHGIPYHYKKDDALFPLVSDPEPEVRGACMETLAEGQEELKQAAPEHFTSMGDSSVYVVIKAYESFANASRRVADGLPPYQWRQATMFYMRGRLINADATLAERIIGASLLGAFDTANPWPRPDLIEVLSREHWAVKAGAITALCEMTPRKEEDLLLHRAETPRILEEFLANDLDVAREVDLRLAVAEGISNFDSDVGRRIARSLLDDPDVRVREAAAESLEKLGEEKPDVAPAGPLAGEAEPLDDIYVKARVGKFTAIITTNRGDVEIELLHREAPRTVQNFVQLAEKGFYDGIRFHRVVPNFVAQAGCPLGNGWGHPGYDLRCEYNPLRYERGMVGMAHAGKDTGGSQFFVTHSAQRHLDGRYTIFGRVTKGMDVVDEIRAADTIQSVRIKKKLF